MKLGDKCDKGSQLRPHIVWFGEPVPMIEKAIPIVEAADIVIVIGTSLGVYPAAGLVNYIAPFSEKIYIDQKGLTEYDTNFNVIKEKAGLGEPILVNKLL